MPATKKKKGIARAGKFTPGGYDLKVKRSAAGLGLFAGEPIPKGKCIIEYFGRTISEEEVYTSRSRYLFEIRKDKTIDGSQRDNTARYINHSCHPNAEIEIVKGRIYVMALKNIKAGDELNYDYGEEYFDEYIGHGKCRCARHQTKHKAKKG